MKVLRIGLAVSALSLMTACSGGVPEQKTASLVALSSCDEASDVIRQMALREMNQQIDESIASFAAHGCGYYGGGIDGDFATPTTQPAPSGASAGGGTTDKGSSSPTNTSGTNNQIAGVDEADFVKNDGHYIYFAQNGVLRIVEAWPAESTHDVSVTMLTGTPKKLFVDGDRALVYTSVAKAPPANNPYYYGGGGGGECTYGYDCDFTGDGTATALLLFDISDRTAPKLLRTVSLSGSLIAARRIGGATHTVVSDSAQPFNDLSYYPSENLCGYQPTPGLAVPPIVALEKAINAYERLRTTNREAIMARDLSTVLPHMVDSQTGAATNVLDQALCESLFRSPVLDGQSFTSVVSFDMLTNGPVHSASVLSRPGAVFASADALYIAVRQDSSYCHGWYAGYDKQTELSAIHKFRIGQDTSTTSYVGSGLANGHALNQFAMDESSDGHLRIATTTGWVPDPSVISQVTVFGEKGNALEQTGMVTGIGPKEDIRAVRFVGDQGYVVTFKKTDPLFVLDLADAKHPQLRGELLIPGFSTYMHPLDATHLLTIGLDANDHDSFAFFDGVLLQIFDVSDVNNPLLVAKHKIGTRGSTSEALTDHLAFTYFDALKVLAIPMTICEGGGDGVYGDQLTFSGLMVFDIDATKGLDNGISERGRVAHPLPPSTDPYGNQINCNTWWTNAHSEVERSIFFDSYVYSIADHEMKVENIDALGSELANISLQ